MTDILAAAVARLSAFRDACGPGALIDPRTRLTIDDLDLILDRLQIEAAEWTAIDPAIRELCD